MEGWKETEVGKIPINWEILLFPKFVILQRGKDLTKVNFKTGNVPVAGSSGIIGYHDTSFVKAPGITVGRSGSCGQVCYYEIDFWAHNTSLYVKDFNGNDELFSYFYLNYLDIGRYKTGVSVPTLDRNSLNNIKIPLPPIPEQRKIAHVLSTVQKAIKQQDNLIRTTTELKKALMQKLFTEGTRGEPQKETEIGLVPESWEEVELDDICERVSINTEPNKDGNTPYVGLEHIIPSRIRIYSWGYENEIVSSKSKFKKGDILYGKLRPYLDKAAIAHFEGICSTDILVFTGKNGVENEFLIHFFHTEKLVDYAKSTTTGVQHPRTSWNTLKKLKLALPKKNERTEIIRSLNSLEDKVEILEKKKQTLTALFKTLLHELMTGQRRVHEMDFEEIIKEETV